MSKSEENDVLTTQDDPKDEVQKDESLSVKDEVKKDVDDVKKSAGTVKNVQPKVAVKVEVSITELKAFMRYLAARTLGSAELDATKQIFKNIFED